MTERSTSRHLPADEQTPRWDNPRADEPGYGRGFMPGVAGTNFAANQLVLPPGQGCPSHTFAGEVIIFGLTGEITYTLEGSQVVVRPGDYLFIPAHCEYSYANTAAGESRMLSIIGRHDEWPATSHYEGVEGDVRVH